jgi:hypothetical protein
VRAVGDAPASTFELFVSYTPRVLGPASTGLLHRAIVEAAPEKEKDMSLVGNWWFDDGTRKDLAEGPRRVAGLPTALMRLLRRRFKTT